jgi:hypothetical protein
MRRDEKCFLLLSVCFLLGAVFGCARPAHTPQYARVLQHRIVRNRQVLKIKVREWDAGELYCLADHTLYDATEDGDLVSLDVTPCATAINDLR